MTEQFLEPIAIAWTNAKTQGPEAKLHFILRVRKELGAEGIAMFRLGVSQRSERDDEESVFMALRELLNECEKH